jgi:cell shape-determining protein MreC
MDYKELLEKYNLLLGENRRLIKENDRLKAQLGIAERKPDENRIAGPTTEKKASTTMNPRTAPCFQV